MVVNLVNDVEDKTINLGSNSLSVYIKEHKGSPQAQYCKTHVNEPNGDINYEYTIWGDNQDVTGYPAWNNCGSFGYDFTLVSRDPLASSPLFVKFDDTDPFQQIGRIYLQRMHNSSA
jgi:hypothetical protein